MPTRLHRRRNPIAQASILRKGGVHEKSRKAKRQKQKHELRKIVSKAMTTDRGHFFLHKLYILCFQNLNSTFRSI